MKIIFIIQNITRSAGTEKATIQLVNSLAAKGFETEIISLADQVNSSPFFKLSDSTVIHHLGEQRNKICKLLSLKTLLRNSQPDIICGTGHNISFFLPFVKNSGSKTIAVEHIDFNSIPPFSKALMKIAYPRLNAVVALTEIAKQKIHTLAKKIAVIPNQVENVEKYSLLAERRIIMVGRISREKAYERLIPIAHQLQTKFPGWKIDVYGGSDDDYKKELEKSFIKNNLQNIKIHDPVKNIEEEYLKSSVFLITSKFEAFPLVVLEAKNYGIPIVGFRNEGTLALIKDNVDGFIVDTEQEAFLKLEMLISDGELKNSLGQNGRQNVKEFGERNIVSKWIELFKQLNF